MTRDLDTPLEIALGVVECSWIRMICIQVYKVITKGLLSNPQQKFH